MTSVVAAHSAGDVRDAIASANAGKRSMEIVCGGTKRAVGRRVDSDIVLDVSGLSGIIDYEPSELVMVARPGTPLATIEQALARENQMLAFEPPDLSRLLGRQQPASLGGMIATNLAGPRRLLSGAPRDHFLGFDAVSGAGTMFTAGGRVMKNVTGYDLPKLLAGSWGTLAVLTQVNVRTSPMSETEQSLIATGLTDAEGVALLTAALKSPAAISGAAHLPAETARALGSAMDESVTCVRLDGTAPSVTARLKMVRDAWKCSAGELSPEASRRLWREIRDATPLEEPASCSIWRIVTEPALAPSIAYALRQTGEARFLFDWGGAAITVAMPEEQAGANPFAGVIPEGRGHYMMLRGSEALRARVPVFSPLPAALSALTQRVKHAFDPAGVLNRGRMYEGC